MEGKTLNTLVWKLCFALGAGLLTSQSYANILNDPSFEGTTANWILVDSTTTFVNSPTNSGSKALAMVHTSDGVTPNTKTVWQFDAAPVKPGVEYTYDAWVSGSGVTGSNTAGKPLAVVRWKDTNGEVIKIYTELVALESFRFADQGTYPYTQDSMLMHLQAPSRAATVDIGFRSWRETTGGTSYFDDVRLVERTTNFNQLGDRLASYEVEDATTLTGGNVESNHKDHTGTGYYNVDTSGAVIEWNNVISGTNRTIAVRFGWEGSPRDIQLIVNGVSQGSSRPEPTGRQGAWATHVFTGVDLPNATNTVRLVVDKTGGEKLNPLIDRLDIHAAGSETTPASVPQNVAASDLTFSDKIELTWDPVIGANRYEILRATSPGGTGNIYAGVTSNGFDDTETDEQVTYYYRVRACNRLDCTTLSPQVSGARDIDTSLLDTNVTLTSTSVDVDLTSIGSSDWRHWGRLAANTFDEKAGAFDIIPNFTPVNDASPQRYTSSRADYTWSDGAPGASATTSAGLRIFDEDKGVRLVLPADQAQRSLTLYLGVNNSQGRLVSTLSDGSQQPVTDIITETNHRARTVTINYAAGSPNQTLTVEWLKTSPTGNIAIDAAAIVVPNQAPIWTAIPSQSVVETQQLVVNLTTTDADGPGNTTLSQTNTLPGNPNILTDNGDGTGTINWTPALGDNVGSPYSVTVTATDSLNASRSRTFNVSVTTNNGPIITPITDKVVSQGQAINFGISASDPDGPAPIVFSQANNLPNSPNVIALDNGDGTGTIAWLSSVGDAANSPYMVTLTATDNANAFTTETFNIVVTASSPPVLNGIGNQSVIEQRSLSINLSATDSDGPFPLLFSATSNLPGNPTIINDNGNGTATLNYTPGFGDAGTYTATVTVSDNGGDVDSEQITIVVAPNQVPEIVTINNQAAVENQQLSVFVTANDPDGPLPINLSVSETLPGNVTVIDNNDGTGELRYTPAAGESNGGPYTVTVTATDADGGSDSETFQVTVAANTAPTLASIGAQSVREQSALTLNLVATDTDGPAPLALTQTNTLPGTPTSLISDNGDGTGTLTWTPAAGDSVGSPYSITVTATDGEGLNISETFSVEVLPQGFNGTLSGAGAVIPNTVDLTAVGTTDWMHHGRNSIATSVNRKIGGGELIQSFQPFNGSTPVAASNNFTTYDWNDGTPEFIDNQEKTGLRVFAVGKGMQFSVEAGLSPRTIQVYLGANRAVGLFRATLSDASAPEYVNTLTSLNGRNGRVYTITFAAGLPGQTLDMTYEVTQAPVAASSIGIDAVALISSNNAPILTAIPNQTAVENQLWNLPLNATDVDGPLPLTLNATHNLPGNPSILTDNNDGTGSLDWTPLTGDAGTYNVSVTATDGDGEVAVQNFTLTVSVNTPPTIDPIADASTIEGQAITIPVTANDPDGPLPLTLTATSNIPGNPGILSNNGDGTGTINWTPGVGDAGGSPYTVTVTATDADGLFATESFDITLTATQPPVLAPIGNLTVIENRLLSVAISATDPDGNLPFAFTETSDTGTTLISNVNGNAGTATLSWTPVTGDSANSPYTATITVMDGSGTPDSETITINVVPNQAPVLLPIGDQNAVESNTLFLTLTATDVDGTAPVSFAQTNTLPGNPNILTDGNNNTATIIWSPPAGTTTNPGNPFSVTVIVTDSDGAQTSETFQITATTTAPPVLTPVSAQTAIEQLPFSINLSATDSDGPDTAIAYNMSNNLPTAASLVDNNDGTATFSWNPAVGDAAGQPYSVTIVVADASGSASSETFVLNVTANANPVLAPIGEQTAVENATFNLNLSATDDGATPVTFSATSNLPGSPNILTDNNDGTATISYQPGLDENLNSPYSITVVVTDENGTQATETFTFNVVRGGRLTGSDLASPANVNLTALNADDWVHWGLGSSSAINRKTGGSQEITTFTALNGASPSTSTAAKSSYTWTDGSPTSTSTSNSMVRVFDAGTGFSLQLPASRSERIARIYVGASNATGTLTATLSDNSAPAFTTTITAGSKVAQEVTLLYRSGGPGQFITIEWTKPGTGGWISLDATSLENLNEAPVLPNIGDQNVVENQALSIALLATDPDGPAPILFTQSNTLPGIPNILTDNGDGTGSLDWTPAVGDATNSPYQVSLTVEDGVGEAITQNFTITVAENTPPTITAIADQNLLETQSLSININATDADGPTPLTLMQTNTLPSAPTFTDNGDGTGSLTWVPSSGDSSLSPFTINIVATDGDAAESTETFIVNLTASLPPELAPIGNQTVIEGRLLAVPLSATDPDNTVPLTFTDTNNIGMSIIANNNTLLWTPPANSAGIYNEVVTVTDAGGTSDSEAIIINVVADQPPVLAPVGTLNAFENAPFNYTFTANDPDGIVVVSYSQNNNLPGGATFLDNGDGTAMLSMNPVTGDSANSPYSMTVTVTDGFGNTDTETFAVTVTPSQPPVIATIDNQTVAEGDTLSINVQVTDNDGPNPLTITETNTLPGSPSILTDNGNGTALIGWTAGAGDSFAGPYSVTITATDGAGESDTETFQVDVTRNGQILVNELINDGASVNLTSAGPTDWVHWGLGGSAAVDRKDILNELISNFTTVNGANPVTSGIMDADYSWSDGKPNSSESGTSTGLRVFDADKGFQITVPASLAERTLNFYAGLRNTSATLTATLSDGSAPTETMTISSSGKSSRLISLNYKAGSNNQTLTITWVKGSGGGWISLEAAALDAVNSDPVISPIGAQSATEGNALTIALNATDDGPAPIAWTETNTLPGAPSILTNFGNGSGEINYTPAVGDATNSPFSVTVTATDAAGASSSETFAITVGTNQDPTLVPVPDQTAVEQNQLVVNIVSNDVDGPDFPVLSQTNTIPGDPVTLTNNGDGTGTLTWLPANGVAANGPYTVTLTATDGVGNTATTSFVINVTASFPPVLAPIGNLQVIENRQLSLAVTATDPDGNATISLSEANSNVGQSILSDNGSGNGTISWTPSIGDALNSPYTLDIVAADSSGESDSETVQITVLANQAPTLAAIGNQTATENIAFALGFSAIDADGLAPAVLTQSNNLPGSPVFVNNGDGTASLSWTPSSADSANSPYNMTVTATDLDGATDSETFLITVSASQAPVIAAISEQNAIENNEFTLEVTATDADGPAPITFTQTNTLPGTLGFTDNNNGSADLSYTPAEGENLNSPYSVTITATDGVGVSSDLTFALVVNREGLINGTLEDAPATVNLTNEGEADWIKWDRALFDRKAGLAEDLISHWTGLGGLSTPGSQGNLLPAFAWSDGTPAGSGSNVKTGAKTFTNGHAFQITTPAGISNRQLKLYVSGRSTTARLTASLSDGSTPDYVEDITFTSKKSHMITLAYKSSQPNQTLTITWEKASSGGWIVLGAATLVEFNQAPEIASIGAQSVIENQLLSFPVTASDLDGPAPLSLSVTNTLPGSPTIFTDNGNGTGVVNWTPTSADISGSPYSITITASDAAGESSTETVQVSVVENQTPVLNAIGNQAVLEGQTLALTFTASDDGSAPVDLTQTNTLPTAPTFVDNNDGTASFSWAPQAGARVNSPYSVTVTATDGDGKFTTETFAVAVTASAAPVLGPIADQNAIEGRQITFGVSATDPDGNSGLTLTASPAVAGLTFIDQGNGNGQFTYTAPLGAATQSPYTVSVTAEDAGGDIDVKSFAINVAANQAPTLANIGTQSATEGVASTFTFSAMDADGVAPVSFSQTNTLPGSPVFVNNGNGTATLTFTPPTGATSGSPYSVTVTVTDSEGAIDTETFAVNITASNPPVLAPIGNQTTVEDVLWTLGISADDPDGPAPLSFTESNTLPGNPSILVDNNDGTATLSFTPATGESNNSPYSITVTVTDGAGASDTETFLLTVNREGSIEHTIATAPGTVDLTADGVTDWVHWGRTSVTDVDRKDTGVALISNWSPVNAPNLTQSTATKSGYSWTNGSPTAAANDTNTGVRHFNAGRGLEFTAPAGVGLRRLSVYVGGSGGSNSRVTATLSDGSAPPKVINFGAGSTYTRLITLNYKASTPNATLNVLFEKVSGTGSWVSLDAAALEEFNQAPVITPIGNQTVVEGQTLALAVNAQDPDGPAPLTLSETNTLPGNVSVLTDNGNGAGTVNWTPATGDSANGPYSITVRAQDGAGVLSNETIMVTVVADQAPVLNAIGNQNVLEGQQLTLNLTATDDGALPVTFMQSNTLPTAPVFVDNGDGTATFTWTPQSGARANSPYSATVTVTDDDGKTATETFVIAVTASAPPQLATIANQNIVEGRLLSINVSATDPDGNNTISLSIAPPLAGLQITDNGNGSGTVTYMPAIGASAGSPYTLTVTAADTGGDSDTATFTINVAANQAPVLANISAQSATEGVELVIPFTATDTDSSIAPVITQSNNLPSSPVFVQNGDGTATLSFTPATGDSANSPYSVNVTATDSDGAIDTQTFSVTVGTSNAPVITPIGDQNAIEDVLFTLNVDATDLDGPGPLTFSETNTLPGNPSILTDNNDGTAVLAFTPPVGSALNSPYSITLTATDGAGVSASETFAVTVNREGLLNVAAAISATNVDLSAEGSTDWTHWGRSSGLDINRKAGVDALISNWIGLGGLSNPSSGGGTNARYSWSDGSPVQSATNVRNSARTFGQGHAFEFTVPANIGERLLKVYVTGRSTTGRLTATLSDGSAPVFTQDIVHSGKQSRTFTINYKTSQPNQTLTIKWEKLTGGGWIDLDAAALQVFNDAPALALIGDQVVIENRPLALNLSATDPDGPSPLAITQTNTLPGSPSNILTDNGDGTALLNWTPQVGDAANGPFTITVTATDGELTSSSELFNVTVVENEDPVLSPIGTQSALENQALNLTFLASDIDGPAPLTFSQTNTLPGSPTLTNNANDTATFNWVPPVGASANSPYQVTVTVVDGDSGTSTETFNINVTKSLPPVLNGIGNRAAIEGRALVIALSATDPDNTGNMVFTQVNGLPNAPVLTNQGNGAALLTWTPPVGSAANSPYPVTVTVTDDGGTGTAAAETFVISVAPNQLPTINAGGDQTVIESQTLSLSIAANDTDGPLPIAITQSNNLPRSVAFNDNGNGTATLSWVSIEGDAQATPYTVNLTATDGQGGATTTVVNVTVNESQAPIIDPIADQDVVEGATLNVAISSNDPDGPAPITLSVTDNLPGNTPSFTDNNDGTGTFQWSSTVGQLGTFSVTVTAVDGVGKQSTESFEVRVNPQGAIAGQSSNASTTNSLTEIGTSDWVRWGRFSVTEIDRKVGVVPLISNYTALNDATPSQHSGGHDAQFEFIDGTPTATAALTRSGLRVFNNDKGYEYTVLADTTERVLKAFIGVKSATGRLTATLSDGSAAPFTATYTQGTTRNTVEVTLTYKASTDNQLLTVRWEKLSGGGWIGLEAAAVVGPLSLPFIEDFASGVAAGWVNVDQTVNVSSWTVANGEYRQDNLVGVNGTSVDGAYNIGSYSYLAGATSLTDHSFSVVATPLAESGEDFGLITRLDAASEDFQRLTFNAGNGFTRLESHVAGDWTTLAHNSRGIAPGTTVSLSMQMQGNRSVAYVDGQKLVGTYNADLDSGTVGLFCRDACKFDSVVIDDVTPLPVVAVASPMEYSIMGSAVFEVSAVVLNLPVGGNVEFEINGFTNACTTATLQQEGYYTATCNVGGQGTYQVIANLVDNGNVTVDSHTVTNVGVGMSYIAVGDSITRGLDDNTRGDGSSSDGYLLNGQGYAPIAVDYLNDLPAFQPTTIHNEGIAGDTSDRVLNDRLLDILERNADVTDMVLMIGVNDAGGASFTPSGLNCNGSACNGTFKGNVQAIVSQANIAGITPLMPLLTPRFGDAGDTAPPYSDPANNARNLLIRDGYNTVISSQLGGRTVGPDLYDVFLGTENRFYLFATNLHPNALGYKIIATEVFNAISGQNMPSYFATDLCLRLTANGACESLMLYKQNLLETGNTLWIDQPHTLTGAPAVLDEGRWIQTADQDRNLNNSDYLEFAVPTSSEVYIAYDANASSAPGWLSANYTNTGDVISTTNPLVPTMELWVQTGVTGTVTVPAANASNNGASANYIVILVEE